MSVDLIDRMIYMNSLGDVNPKIRIENWLNKSEKEYSSEFHIGNEKYFWSIICSKEFIDIIEEDETNWFYIRSENGNFKSIAKIRNGFENLIGKIDELYLTSLWLLKSDIETLKVNEKPILIWSPHLFQTKTDKLEYEFKQLITKLKNPKVKITEFVDYKTSKELKRRIR